MRVFVSKYALSIFCAGDAYGLFIFLHKICQQIRDDCPLQGRRGCVKLIRKDKGGQRTESQRFVPRRTLK